MKPLHQTMLGAAFFVALAGAWACAGLTPQQKTRQGLQGALVAVQTASSIIKGDKFCRGILEECKYVRQNPCPKLISCQAKQVKTLEALRLTVTAIQLADDAIKTSELP